MSWPAHAFSHPPLLYSREKTNKKNRDEMSHAWPNTHVSIQTWILTLPYPHFRLSLILMDKFTIVRLKVTETLLIFASMGAWHGMMEGSTLLVLVAVSWEQTWKWRLRPGDWIRLVWTLDCSHSQEWKARVVLLTYCSSVHIKNTNIMMHACLSFHFIHFRSLVTCMWTKERNMSTRGKIMPNNK